MLGFRRCAIGVALESTFHECEGGLGTFKGDSYPHSKTLEASKWTS